MTKTEEKAMTAAVKATAINAAALNMLAKALTNSDGNYVIINSYDFNNDTWTYYLASTEFEKILIDDKLNDFLEENGLAWYVDEDDFEKLSTAYCEMQQEEIKLAVAKAKVEKMRRELKEAEDAHYSLIFSTESKTARFTGMVDKLIG